MRSPRLCAIPAQIPFLDTLARRWLAEHPDDPSRGLILLPTRRAARSLAESFLHVRGGQPMLLPRIGGLGALDETPLALSGTIDLPPAVPELVRLATLARLILALPPDQGGVPAAGPAWALARTLAGLMDEAERAERPIDAALAAATNGEHAEHWQITLRFLRIVTQAWPAWLTEHGLMNPAARQVALIRAQAAAWQVVPPVEPVWVAGTTAAIPAVAALLQVVANMATGCVVLPGPDLGLIGTAPSLVESHPQAALAALLAAMGAGANEVAAWGEADARTVFLQTALLPAERLSEWRDTEAWTVPPGLTRLAAADEQEEAVAIALVLRDAIETPGRRAALVTPDRALALRVAVELRRWGIAADDSAGEELSQTPAGVFLRLAARAAAENLAPIPLLSLLKHPMAGLGLSAAACRDAARRIERHGLRGPRPPPGFSGLRQVVAQSDLPFVDRLFRVYEPFLRGQSAFEPNWVATEALAALLSVAEAAAEIEGTPGPMRLWSGEEGEALAAVLTEALDALEHLPAITLDQLPELLDAVLAGHAVRGRRALRGRDNAAEHPRILIWGLLEARLQSVDTVVLGGLAEGAWPAEIDPGPWLSRPMRRAAGLPCPEEALGLAAHDFVMAACAAPLAVLSCPMRRDGAPVVPARWLARIEALLGRPLPDHPAVAWARLLDRPIVPTRIPAPAPRPPAALRPRRLSVTDIETLITDPYAIYAKHVLRLRPLDDLEQETDGLDYGQIVHSGIEGFLRDHGTALPDRLEDRLRDALEKSLLSRKPRPALRAWWQPRLYRIADWIAAEERRRRNNRRLSGIAFETQATLMLAEAGGFELTARADRIECYADGAVVVMDYKTGAPPNAKQLRNGSRPQLPLEAAMCEAGAFGDQFRGPVAELVVWHVSGGREPGKVCAPVKSDEVPEVVGSAFDHLRALLRVFADPACAYLHCPHPARAPDRRPYAQLARAGERATAGDED